MGFGNRNKVFFLSFLGQIFFQLLIMAKGRQAVLFTTYINLSPKLPKTILGENTARFFSCYRFLRLCSGQALQNGCTTNLWVNNLS
jgi:hypothetical protein